MLFSGLMRHRWGAGFGHVKLLDQDRIGAFLHRLLDQLCSSTPTCGRPWASRRAKSMAKYSGARSVPLMGRGAKRYAPVMAQHPMHGRVRHIRERQLVGQLQSGVQSPHWDDRGCHHRPL
jgi:hypothetical protein